MFVFFFFELRTCAAPVSKSKCPFLVQVLPPAAARPPAPSPLGPPLPRVALRVRGAGTGSGGALLPAPSLGAGSAARGPDEASRHRGLRKGGRGGGTRGPGGGVRLGHCARAGAGRWSLARGLQSQLCIVSTSLAANRPQVVGVDSVRCAESLTESRIVFTICS